MAVRWEGKVENSSGEKIMLGKKSLNQGNKAYVSRDRQGRRGKPVASARLLEKGGDIDLFVKTGKRNTDRKRGEKHPSVCWKTKRTLIPGGPSPGSAEKKAPVGRCVQGDLLIKKKKVLG